MKIKTINILVSLFAVLFFFTACQEDEKRTIADQKDTWEVRNITSTSAEISGIVVAGTFVQYGVCWSSENTEPTVNDSLGYIAEPEGAVFWIPAENLEHKTKYYARAYFMASSGAVTYGKTMNFTTLANLATVNGVAVSDITATSAWSGGDVPYDGRADVTAKGLVVGTSSGTTIADEDAMIIDEGEGTGDFTTQITGLVGGTDYYVRAFATNSIGTAYSDEQVFTTEVGYAVATTDSVVDVTKTTATLHGNVLYTGGAHVFKKGFHYGTAPNPTAADNEVEYPTLGLGLGKMYATLTGLDAGVTYYARAFAENATGVAYGDEFQFTTTPDIIVWYVPGGYVEASNYPGGANWTPESSPFVSNTLDVGDQMEGYVWMNAGTNEWKFAANNDWSPNYGDNAPADGTLEMDGDNIVSPNGYYKINVDMSTDPMTYTAVATTWGVIGSATADGWDSDQDLTFQESTQTWRGQMHLTAAEAKFRANDDWTINYGDNDPDGGLRLLSQDGANIAIAVEGDYDITLDLSTPVNLDDLANANQYNYTYMFNQWGIIGDATPGGWGDPTFMTWDAVNSVFTITADLTAGEFKFRANDNWTVNLGGDLNALTQDGANIPIGSDGNYTITLNTMTMVGTVTQN
jgi:hypothetical protein